MNQGIEPVLDKLPLNNNFIEAVKEMNNNQKDFKRDGKLLQKPIGMICFIRLIVN